MTEPVCDFVGVTVPEDVWPELRAEVAAELDAIGMAVEYQRDRETLWRSPDADSGTVKTRNVGMVRAIGASGAVCAGLRAAGRFAAFLAAIAARPHRVTRLDLAYDVKADAPVVIAEAVEKGRAGGVALTRKSIKPRDVTTFLGVCDDGRVSGTAYFGGRNADVRLCMYDKRKERLDKGLCDVGPLTRYELRLRAGTGATLRDANCPRELFWHYMPATLLPPPSDLSGWVANGSGFDLERLPPLSAAERLRRRVVDSPDVIALADLAVEVGPGGLEMLLSGVRSVYQRRSAT